MLEMWLITQDFLPLGLMEAFNVSCVLRYAAEGTWTAQILGESGTAAKIRPGCRVMVTDHTGPVFSGPITTINRSRLNNGTLNLNLSGKTENSLLFDRRVYPDPFRPLEAQRSDYYTDADEVGRLIATTILRNTGSSALPERIVTPLRVRSHTTGPTASIKARFSNLGREIAALERQHKVWARCLYDRHARSIVVDVLPTTDRSRSMVLRQRTGVLGESSVSITAPSATAVILAGDGEGRNRRMLARSLDRSDWWGKRRVEEFKDRRDTSSDKELAEAWEKLIPDIIGSAAVTAAITEGDGQVFGVNYHLGDRIAIDLDGTVYTDVVQAANITWDQDHRKASISIGQKDAQDVPSPAWVRRIRELEDELATLKGA